VGCTAQWSRACNKFDFHTYALGVREDFLRNSPESRIDHTLAKELALYVVLYSPIQMVVDSPEEYAKRPEAFQFIKDVPTDWDETTALDGEVGEFAVIARKDRNSEDWYVGAVTDTNSRTLQLSDLSFLGGGSYEAQIYADAADADFETNPYEMEIRSERVTKDSRLSFDLARSGGVAVRFRKL